MPGILPMKLIKCGSSQTRIAQACDRCRSKKIRCDGVRPCCSQCANVGFECKTSDKLSRRAFPRGYTESLEERVRNLEREVRELKDLLDSKDEQLEMLSKIRSFSPYSPPSSTTDTMHGLRKTPDNIGSGGNGSTGGNVTDEVIAVGEPLSLITMDNGDGLYMGPSSGRVFVDTLKRRLGETGRSTIDFDTEQFFRGQPLPVSADPALQPGVVKPPPRLLSDHLLVSYFQEYHPLFPVLHRPTFLSKYEKLVSSDASAAASLPAHDIAKLFLVFAIALQQTESRNGPDEQSFDIQWQRALDTVVSENSINTIQCLVLAQLYYFARGDYTKLLHYKNLAVGIALRLGLNHNQGGFALGALSGEMRKRAFWCTYSLDGFSAAMLGLPKLLREDEVDAEYPSDIDDEYVSEEGFLPTLPGDSTKISSALALFRVSRVLGQVLGAEYSVAGSRELSHNRLKELEEELDAWKAGLAPHLRLEFANGSPATNIVHSRSPLLVFAYHYIRTLIHRPIVGTNYPQFSPAALLAIRDSSKCMVQISELLTERKLGFAFCLNRAQVLLLAGFTFIYSAVDSQPDGVLAKENQKLLSIVLNELQNVSPNSLHAFGTVASSVVNFNVNNHASKSPQTASPLTRPSTSRQMQSSSIGTFASSAPTKIKKSVGQQSTRRTQSQDFRGIPRSGSPAKQMSSSMTDLSLAPRARSLHQHALLPRHAKTMPNRHLTTYEPSGLDFMWSADGLQDMVDDSPAPSGEATSADDWERMLATMDANHTAHIYGDGSGRFPSHYLPATYDERSIAGTSDGFRNTPSLSSFDTLSDGNEDSQPPSSTYGSDEGGLSDFLPMVTSAGAAPILTNNGWNM